MKKATACDWCGQQVPDGYPTCAGFYEEKGKEATQAMVESGKMPDACVQKVRENVKGVDDG
ncbi:hypothetical protein QGN29_01590 [Temperatibacter marinus]|uniref:Uncharacterized protein n=1 Tax=Temperatibacter marinus TaxID=1456591 RepID=A0AA52EJ96_9PROT|nr:hypothetical protein [Temperatibacter marinus]WND03056.1 hypothetical protein QGN29_01590 [Temperatibacter marinus]